MSIKSEPTVDNSITDADGTVKKEVLPDSSVPSKISAKPAAFLVKNMDQTFTLVSNGTDLSMLKSGNATANLAEAIKKLIPQLVAQNKGHGLRLAASLQPGADGKLQLVMPIQSSVVPSSPQSTVPLNTSPNTSTTTVKSTLPILSTNPEILKRTENVSNSKKSENSLKALSETSSYEGFRNIRGCNCRKSHCLKNYCECYEAKHNCTDLCRCVGCANTPDIGEARQPVAIAPCISPVIAASSVSNHSKRPVTASAMSADGLPSVSPDVPTDTIVIEDDSDSESSAGKKARLDDSSVATKFQNTSGIRKEVSIMPRLVPAPSNGPKYQMTNVSGTPLSTTLTLPPNLSINDIMAAVSNGRATLIPQSTAGGSVQAATSQNADSCLLDLMTSRDGHSVVNNTEFKSVTQPTLISSGTPGMPSLVMMPCDSQNSVQGLRIRIPLSLAKSQLSKALEVPQKSAAQKAFLNTQKLQLEFTPKPELFNNSSKEESGIKPSDALTAAYVQRHINAAMAACNMTQLPKTIGTKVPIPPGKFALPSKLPILPLKSSVTSAKDNKFARPIITTSFPTATSLTATTVNPIMSSDPQLASSSSSSVPQITSVSSVPISPARPIIKAVIEKPVAISNNHSSGIEIVQSSADFLPPHSSVQTLPIKPVPTDSKYESLSMSVVRQGVTLRILTRQLKNVQTEMSRLKRLVRNQKVLLNRALYQKRNLMCASPRDSSFSDTSYSYEAGHAMVAESLSCDVTQPESLNHGSSDDQLPCGEIQELPPTDDGASVDDTTA